MKPQDLEAVKWRRQVSAFIDALQNKTICSQVKNIKEFMK